MLGFFPTRISFLRKRHLRPRTQIKYIWNGALCCHTPAWLVYLLWIKGLMSWKQLVHLESRWHSGKGKDQCVCVWVCVCVCVLESVCLCMHAYVTVPINSAKQITHSCQKVWNYVEGLDFFLFLASEFKNRACESFWRKLLEWQFWFSGSGVGTELLHF